MSAGVIITIVVVLVILAVVAALASRMVLHRSNTEYDKRRRRVEGLGIKPLSAERRALYGDQWVGVQEAFIDDPAQSVRTAASLVTAVAADRGYETGDTGQFQTDLSVNYGDQLDGYRSALAVTENAGEAATEKLRQALLDYRALFRELAGISDDSNETVTSAAPVTTEAPAAQGTPAS